MPDLQEPSRVLIGGMQTDAGLAAIQQLVREGGGLLSNSRSVALCRRCSIDNISCSLVYIYLGSWAHPLEYKSQAAYVSDGESESAERIISMEISRRDISCATAFVCARPPLATEKVDSGIHPRVCVLPCEFYVAIGYLVRVC